MLVFAEGGKTLGAGTRTNNKRNPHMTPSTGIEPGPHWWEAAWEANAQPLRHPCSLYVDLKPAAHERKELRKLPREVISSAVQLTCAVEFLWEFRLARPWGKYLTCLIFEISPREAKFSQKLNRTLEETTELITSRGSLLSSFLSCAAGLTIWHYKISLICRLAPFRHTWNNWVNIWLLWVRLRKKKFQTYPEGERPCLSKYWQNRFPWPSGVPLTVKSSFLCFRLFVLKFVAESDPLLQHPELLFCRGGLSKHSSSYLCEVMVTKRLIRISG